MNDSPKPSPNGDLLARLRSWQETPHEGDPMIDALLVDLPEAVDTIERQNARIDQLLDKYGHAADLASIFAIRMVDYAAERNEARAALAKAEVLLAQSERFMSGFEGDTSQYGVDDLLCEIRASLTPAQKGGGDV